ncbi:hypothetical protein GCM10027406_05850 [Leifsonia lichenia]
MSAHTRRAAGGVLGPAGTVLRQAGIWALDYVYAVRQQVRSAFRRDDPAVLAVGRPDASTVLLLPGIFETWRFMLPLARHLHDRGHSVHVVTALGRNGSTIDDAAELAAGYLAEHGLQKVTIVAHSKGGLVAKRLMSSDAGSRVRLTVAVSTPFSGSVYARFLPTRSLRALAPTDEALVRLAAESAANARIVSVYGWFDPHIPGGSELDGAKNIELPVGGHFRILARRELLEVVDEFVEGRQCASHESGPKTS